MKCEDCFFKDSLICSGCEDNPRGYNDDGATEIIEEYFNPQGMLIKRLIWRYDR